MFRRKNYLWAAVLSGGLLLATGGPVAAQHGHGGHGGGHGGHGGHFGGHGGHYGGHYGGHLGGHYGGHHFGHYQHYYPYGSIGLGYGYYPSYGYGTYDYGYYPSSSLYVPSYGSAYYQQGTAVPAGQAYIQQSPAAPALGNAARIHVTVADPTAQVWLDGAPTTSRGTLRQYETPELEPGKKSSYTLKVSQNRGGQVVIEERLVEVSAGQASSVDFTQPPAPEKVGAPK